MSPQIEIRPRRGVTARAMGCRRPVLVFAIGLSFAPPPAAAIVGGVEEAGALAQASVMVLNARGGVCSGVLVASDALLTAAHCVTGASDYRVHYRAPDGEPVLLEPAAISVHPGYDRGAIAARRRSIDLALVHLSDALPGRFVPAMLATEPGLAGAALTFGGFGVARERDARSTGTFRSVALRLVEPYGRSTILVWARGAAGAGAGACEGDSGGPVADRSGAVVAVTSWASGTGRSGCGDVSQGVLLGPQRTWIDRVLAGWGTRATWR